MVGGIHIATGGRVKAGQSAVRVMREPIVVSGPYDEDQSEFAYHWPSVEQRPLPTRGVVGMCNRAILATELRGQRQSNRRQTVPLAFARGCAGRRLPRPP